MFAYFISNCLDDINVGIAIGEFIGKLNMNFYLLLFCIPLFTAILGMFIPGSTQVKLFGTSIITIIATAGGNPLYDWDAMAADGYDWWIARIRAALELVDYIRIDHFRGFQDYWAVPAGEKTAENGQWLPGPGHRLFQAIRERLGDIPIIAEDLGVITEEVRRLRDDFGLPGMKILQFAFDLKEAGQGAV